MADDRGDTALSALFDTWPDAEAARSRLLALGLPPGDVRMIPESPEVQAEGRDVGTAGGGFLGALVTVLFPRAESRAYEEALAQGGVLLVAERVPATLQDAALAALDVEETRDLDPLAAPADEPGEGPGLRRDASRSRGRVRAYTRD